MTKKPDKRGKNAKRTVRKGKLVVNFGVSPPGKRPPNLRGVSITAGPGGIDLPSKRSIAYRLALEGFDDAIVARICGVPVETLEYWRAAHPNLDKTMKDGMTAADAEVLATLYDLSVGYTRTVTEVHGKDADEVRYRKYFQPELGAIKFWLKNRRPTAWVERQEVTGKDGKPLAGTSGIDRESKRDIINSIVAAVKPKPDGKKQKK